MVLLLRTMVETDLQAITDILNDEIRSTTSTFQLDDYDLESRHAWLADLQRDDYPCLVADVGSSEHPKSIGAWSYNPCFINKNDSASSRQGSVTYHAFNQEPATMRAFCLSQS
jgi:hypothetical protein